MTVSDMPGEEEPRQIAVLLVDDHPPFRIGMHTLLEQDRTLRVVGEAATGRQAISLAEALCPDIIVLDCQLPDLDGPSVCAEIRQRGLNCAVLGLSAYDDVSYVHGLLSAGARGYILKNEAPATIVRAIHAIFEGESYLSATIAQQLARFGDRAERANLLPTVRENEVLHLLAEGMANAEIASQLQIAERTVAFHVENLMNKLNTSNRTETVIAAIRNGWLSVARTDR